MANVGSYMVISRESSSGRSEERRVGKECVSTGGVLVVLEVVLGFATGAGGMWR